MVHVRIPIHLTYPTMDIMRPMILTGIYPSL
jgi:hypothetical protein